MKHLITIALLTLLPTLVFAQNLNLFDSAMAQVGLTSEDIRFDQDEMATWGGDRWRLTYFTMFHRNPLKLPKYGRMSLEALQVDCGNITALVANAGRKIDCPVRRSLIGDPLEKYTRQLDSLPRTAWSSTQKSLIDPSYAKLRAKIDLLYALLDDNQSLFTAAFAEIAPDNHRRNIFDYFLADSQKHNDLVEDIAVKVDFNRMVGGAEDIAEALRRLSDSLEYCIFPSTREDFPTPLGLIAIGTNGNDEYSYQSPPLLILDPGGDDQYHISGYPVNYPLSAIIDVSGNDRYISTDSTSPGIGGAVLGMSVVLDKYGNDYYDAKNVAQGCGIFGVGAVMDYNGRDTYRARSYAQGAAAFGVGVLSDSTGNDSLYCWMNSQGFGYTMGCGLCINYSGDDIYIAEDSILFSPGQQTQEHNSSLSQGVGFGKRADYIDGHSWAGGVGILCDVLGADKYSAGLFAQGCGYWFALGMLLDGSGDDIYHSVWYTLGSGAHFAIGYLDDFAGNDSYNATMNMSIGSGHDFNIGYFNERSGNDTYLAPGLSLGGGNFQGIGIFHDWLGDDRYTTSGGFNLGGARGLTQGARAYLRTFGVFVDAAGKDIYSDSRVRNNLKWISPKSDSTKSDPFEIGVGIDK